MKKTLLIAALAVFGFSQTNAQEVTFGAKAGLNLASLIGDDVDDDASGRTSFHVGGVAHISLSEMLAIQPELVYSAQGSSFSEDGFESNTRLDYINLPIMVDVTIADGLSLQGGPQFGFNISAENEFDFGELGSGTEDIEDVNTLDLAAGIGAQYKLESGLFFQARYTVGFSDVAEDAGAQNSVIGISAGFFF